MRRRGFSLIEVTLSAVLLSLALLACFQLFEWSSRAFILTHLRSGLEGESRRVLASLATDLRQGDIHGLSVIDPTLDPTRRVTAPEGESVERDAYSLPSLTHWEDPASINPATALPRWDRYAVVYATLANPGWLIKQYCTPGGTAPYQAPLSDLSGRINENPALNPQSTRPVILSQSVHEFRVTFNDDTDRVTYHLTLAGRGTRKSQGRLTNERCQVSYTTRLENSGAF